MRSRWRRWFENSTATTFAILLHVVVGVLLLVAFKGSPVPEATPQSAPAIEAVVLDESRIQQELARLETAERERQTKELARQAALREAEEQRKREEQRLAEIKREQAEAEKNRLQEQEQLARIKQQAAETEAKRKAEEKAAAEAKRKAEAAAKSKAEAEAKRKAEEKAAAEAEAKRKAEAEAKRKAEEKAAAEARRKAEAEAKRKAEEEARRKAEAEAKRKAEAEAKRKAEEEARQRLAESLRQQAKQRQIDSITAQYIRLIEQRIQHNWLLPPGSRRGLICLLHIKLDDRGYVLDVSIASSSGDPNFDRSAIAAVLKAEPLPIPKDPDAMTAFRSFNFKFNPGG